MTMTMGRTGELVIAALFAAALASAASAQSVSQTIPLQPGWNAIHLEVQPEPADPTDPACAEPLAPGCIFLGLPVASVWHYVASRGTATYVTTPGVDDLTLETGWLGWFPASSEKSILNSLDEIRVNRAYLVNLEGAQAQALTVHGRPSIERKRWTPDAFSLTGFPVDEASPATFAEFFAGSEAHADAVNDGLIYRLTGTGVWEPVLDAVAETIHPGVAYWVFTRGGSQHQGPLEVVPPFGDGLDFGEAQVEVSLRVRKHSGASETVDFALQPAGGAALVPLAYRAIAPVTFEVEGRGPIESCTPTWLDFPGTLSLPAPPCDAGAPPSPLEVGQDVVLQLGVVRRDLSAPDAAAVLRVSNGTGVRWLVPVAATEAP